MIDPKPNKFGDSIKTGNSRKSGAGIGGAIAGAVASSLSKRSSVKKEQAMSDIRKSENEHLAGLHTAAREQIHGHETKKRNQEARIAKKLITHASTDGTVSRIKTPQMEATFRAPAKKKATPKK